MNRKRRIATVLIALVAVSMAAFVAPAAAQQAPTVSIDSTTLSDTDGDGLQDQVEVEVTSENALGTTVTLGESNFEVDLSPTDQTQGVDVSFDDTDGDGDNESVTITKDPLAGPNVFTQTVTANIVSGQSDGETGTVDVSVDQGADTADTQYIIGQTGGAGNTASANPRVINDGDTLFLGEDDIDTNAGVFAGVSPGEFVDPDSAVLTIDNGVVDPSNAISTYENDDTGDVIRVREARVQSLFVIDALSDERLDDAENREIEQTGEGQAFNVQFAIDYNYDTSASIDLDESLSQDGADVTDIYFDSRQDAALSPQDSFVSQDEEGRTYDALFNFDIDDTGEYTFTAAPASGDDRPDGRDVGFDTREDATDTTTVTIIDDEDVEIELGSEDANQGDRVDFDMVGLLEGEVAIVTAEAEDLRTGDFGPFAEIISGFVGTGQTIGDDNPAEFTANTFRQVNEVENRGLIFEAENFDFADTNIGPGDRLSLDAAGVGEGDLVVFDTEDLDDVGVFTTDTDGNLIDITDDVAGPDGVLDLTSGTQGTGTSDLERFANSAAGPGITLQRMYAVIQRDAGASAGQLDTEKLDDTSVDLEAYGLKGANEGEGINPGTGNFAVDANLPGILSNAFRNGESFRDEDDETSVEVEEVEITVDSPSDTYVPGTEVDLTGSITGTADDVVILVRDEDNYFQVTTETTDRAAGNYEETGFELSGDEVRTQAARDILAQPGVYRYGVIDGIDTDIIQLVQPGRRILGQDGLDEADFNQGSSTQVSLRVVEPSLEGQFRTFDGSVYEPDGLDVRGTLVGPREYLTFLTDDRGNSRVNEFSADEDDGAIDEDDVDVSGLTEGTIQASILSPGRDTQFGDGSFRIPQIDDVRDEEFADASLNNFIDFAEDLSATTRTQEQVREILLDQTIRQSGSDDLIVTEEFRLTDDSRTAINDIVPDELRDNLTGVNTIEVGETMVVRGVTNRNPDDATIIVEAEQGPSTAELGTGIADEWAADGEEGDAPGGVWSTELEVDEEVEPGEYVIRSDDGDRIDEQTVEIVAEGTLEEGARLQDEAAELQQQVQELEGQIETLEGERDDLESQVSDLESQNSDLESQVSDLESQLEEAQQTDQNETDTGEQEEEGQPGFTALAALVALIAVALLALRRREEDE